MTEEEIMIISLREFTKAKWRKLKQNTVELKDRAKGRAKEGLTKENFKNFFENIKNKIVDFYNKIVVWLKITWGKVKTWWILKVIPFFKDLGQKIKRIWSDFVKILKDTWEKLQRWWKFTEPYTYVAFYTCQVINTATGITTIPYRFTTWLQEKADIRLKEVITRKTAIEEVLEMGTIVED